MISVFASIAIYIVLLMASFWRIRNINWLSVSFLDGAFIGSVFFVAFPLALMTIDGTFYVPIMHKSFDYAPLRDFAVTYNLLLGWAITILLSTWRRRSPSNISALFASQISLDLKIVLAIYLSVVLFSFFMSGKIEGGHWQEKLGEAFQSNPLLILAAALKNVYRAMLFGVLIFAVETKRISPMSALAIGFGVVVIDLALTFNRITAAYWLVMTLIILRRRLISVSVAFIISWPFVSFWSDVWTYVRATAIQGGYTFQGFLSAVDYGWQNKQGETAQSLAEQSMTIFESANILVFAYIVENVPNKLEPLWGWTFLLRPLAIFIPSTFWPGKPPVYGTILGDHMMGVEITLNATLFGEVFGNFFIFWPLVLALTLVLIDIGFNYFLRFRLYAGHMGFFAGFAVGRMEMTVATISLLGVFILVFVSAAFRLVHRTVLKRERGIHTISRGTR